MNIFEDAYASLAEEDGAPGDKNAKQQITPFQSFTDLTYSKGKRVKAIAWLPKKKGVVAVACTQPLTFDERLENAGEPALGVEAEASCSSSRMVGAEDDRWVNLQTKCCARRARLIS